MWGVLEFWITILCINYFIDIYTYSYRHVREVLNQSIKLCVLIYIFRRFASIGHKEKFFRKQQGVLETWEL